MNVLFSQYYPAIQAPVCAVPLVLLHGWGTDSRSWTSVLPQLNKQFNVITLDLPNFGQSPPLHSADLDAWLALIIAALPERSLLLGWSLGGMLATQLAARYPHRVAALITLASNVSFIQRDGWQAAMTDVVEQHFYRDFMGSSQLTLKRFCVLQAQGEIDERAAVKHLRGLLRLTATNLNAGWGKSLQLLSRIDNRKIFSALNLPGLHIFAQNDSLVPVACAREIQQLNSRQQVSVLDCCGHALHQHESDAQLELLAQLQNFLCLQASCLPSAPFVAPVSV